MMAALFKVRYSLWLPIILRGRRGKIITSNKCNNSIQERLSKCTRNLRSRQGMHLTKLKKAMIQGSIGSEIWFQLMVWPRILLAHDASSLLSGIAASIAEEAILRTKVNGPSTQTYSTMPQAVKMSVFKTITLSSVGRFDHRVIWKSNAPLMEL